MNEINRIISVYKKRDAEGEAAKQWTYFNLSNLFIIHQREGALIRLLHSCGITSLSDKLILDVGCGFGGELQKFCDYGATPENLYGVDLLEGRVGRAKNRYPLFKFMVGNAEKLPFPDGYFDIVFQFTCFSSILDETVKGNISGEMLRVLKKNGIILWYDIKPAKSLLKVIQNGIKILSLIKRGFISKGNKKLNSADEMTGFTVTKAIGIDEIKRLFEGSVIKKNTITLYYPFIQLLVPRLSIIAYLLSGFKIFNTHYLSVIQKR